MYTMFQSRLKGEVGPAKAAAPEPAPIVLFAPPKYVWAHVRPSSEVALSKNPLVMVAFGLVHEPDASGWQ
jgi:hypothetical protein